MIIEQLTLSNWLSYPAKWITNGEPQKPCFDFQNHPSYVIFGKNGAGKSSIMEAILFALFGDYARTLDYRGVKRQGVNNDNAIRTGENSATVELVFSLNGRRCHFTPYNVPEI
ncbi:MAG: AAA family ATPase, partial [Anaerolineales bacterium]|nr:AAA family ATPase [Anaerolineales bacterium]